MKPERTADWSGPLLFVPMSTSGAWRTTIRAAECLLAGKWRTRDRTRLCCTDVITRACVRLTAGLRPADSSGDERLPCISSDAHSHLGRDRTRDIRSGSFRGAGRRIGLRFGGHAVLSSRRGQGIRSMHYEMFQSCRRFISGCDFVAGHCRSPSVVLCGSNVA